MYVTHTRVFVGENLHILYQGAQGLGLGRTFVRPFSVDFIQQKRDDWFMKYSCSNCQWKQEGKSKSFPEYINGHDQGQHYKCQKYFAPIKQKSGILVSKLN